MNVHLILELPVLPPRQPSRLVEYLAMQVRRNDKEFQTFQATFLCTRMPTEIFKPFGRLFDTTCTFHDLPFLILALLNRIILSLLYHSMVFHSYGIWVPFLSHNMHTATCESPNHVPYRCPYIIICATCPLIYPLAHAHIFSRQFEHY